MLVNINFLIPRTHRWANASSFFPSRCSPVFLNFSLVHWCTTSSSSLSSRLRHYHSMRSLNVPKNLNYPHIFKKSIPPSYLHVFFVFFPSLHHYSTRSNRSLCASPIPNLQLPHLPLPAKVLTLQVTAFSTTTFFKKKSSLGKLKFKAWRTCLNIPDNF